MEVVLLVMMEFLSLILIIKQKLEWEGVPPASDRQACPGFLKKALKNPKNFEKGFMGDMRVYQEPQGTSPWDPCPIGMGERLSFRALIVK